MKALDLTGRRFGRVVVVRRLPTRAGRAYWEVQCDCGTTSEARAGELTRSTRPGKRSCGCLAGDARRAWSASPPPCVVCCDESCRRLPREFTVDGFLERLSRPATGCWLWSGGTTGFGYGVVGGSRGATKVATGAHRVSWEVAHGRHVPDGLQVLHRCDVPACCRPDHLFLGTARDNVRDCVAKGRHARLGLPGELHPRAKLTLAAVAEIRARASGGARTRTLAREYGVSPSAIRFAVTGKTWRSAS